MFTLVTEIRILLWLTCSICTQIFANLYDFLIEEFFFSDPELKTSVPVEYLSHKEKYEQAIRLSCLLFQKINKWLAEHESGSAMDAYQ